jgi:hypothetical protein
MPNKRKSSQRRKLASSYHLSFLKGMKYKIITKKILSTLILKTKKGKAVTSLLIEMMMIVSKKA